MTKHLSQNDVDKVCDQINKIRGSLTWDKIEAAVRDKLGFPHSKWALRERPEIKQAYETRKAELKANKTQKKTSKPSLPPNPEQVIADLEAKVHSLQGQLAIILDNAAELGIPLERISRPPNPATYNPTPGRS